MDTALLNELVSVNLRYSAVAKPLRTRAITQAIAKVLYTVPLEQTTNVKSITKDVCAVCEIDGIPRKSIDEGLSFLKELGLGEKVGGSWKISNRGREAIEIDLNRSRSLVESIVERHFPKAIPTQKLKDWLREVCTAYFGSYSTYWAASICGTTPKVIPSPTAWHYLVPKTAKENSMEEYVEALTEGFGSFLDSNDPRDQEFMWCLGQAMFAARLISSTIGADPLTTNELKNTVAYLDTNILLLAQLEGHRQASSVESLALVLEQLNIELRYLPNTGEEYERTVSQIGEQTLRVVGRYSKSVIDKANDPFARTARTRGCSSIEDYQRLFEEIQQIPAGINDVPIRLCEDEEIIQAAGIGQGDTELKKQIAEAWSLMRRRSAKRPNAVIHDASLMYAIENARAKGERCWVLTTDKTMSWLSSQRSGGANIISWIDLDTLLNIFALDLTGSAQGIESFGPLMSAVLKNEVQPMLGTYETQDLAWLLDIEERCADLTEEQTKKCVTVVTQARLSGKRVDDLELQIDIQRAFQGDRLELVSGISMAKADNEVLRTELENEKISSKEYQGALLEEWTSKFRRQAWMNFVVKAGLAIIVGSGLITAGIIMAASSQSGDTTLMRIGLPALFIGSGSTTILPILWRQVISLRRSLKSALERAQQKVSSLGIK